MKRPYKNVTLHLDPQVWEALHKVASQKRTYIRDIVTEALCFWLLCLGKGIVIKAPPLKIKAPPKPPKGLWKMKRYPGMFTKAQLKAVGLVQDND